MDCNLLILLVLLILTIDNNVNAVKAWKKTDLLLFQLDQKKMPELNYVALWFKFKYV